MMLKQDPAIVIPRLTRRDWIAGAGAGAIGLILPARAFASAGGGFTHGVASGEPRQRSVLLWTRYASADYEVPLRVEVAADEGFRRVVRRGDATAHFLRDHTAKVLVDGLRPGRTYYYRFLAPDGGASATGRTRTLPEGRVDRFRMAVFSCANATSGWFNAYAHAAARDDIDLAVHLGDYIYESPIDRPGALPGLAAARGIVPAHETVALADYRARYAAYRSDPDLSALHRAMPMIAVPDDHETANNAWRDGASAHSPDEGPWPARKQAGMQAYQEWLPITEHPFAEYQIGDLATLFRIETRVSGRDRQVDPEDVLRASGSLPAAVQAIRAMLDDEKRSMMGAAQERWLADGIARSARGGTRWQLLAQQVIMGPMVLPASATQWVSSPERLSPQRRMELELGVAMGRASLAARFDRWDGYPAARERLLGGAQAARANLVTLSGDSHNAWAYRLSANGRPAGVEFAGHSVASLGMESRLDAEPLRIAEELTGQNPELAWCDTSQRGYMVIDVTPDRVRAEWVFVPARNGRSAASTGSKALVTERNSFTLA